MDNTAQQLNDQPIKILVAEDDFAITLALKTIIKNNFNCELTITHNGEEAWIEIQKQPFDLILSDWNMPLKTGCELLHDVRTNDSTKLTPFIMLTARADKHSVIDAVKSGVTDYIHKPFDRAALIEKISSTLDKCASSSVAEQSEPPKKRSIVDEIVTRLKNDSFDLPVLSNIAETVTTMVTEQDSSVTEVAEIVKNDPIVTARILALANSPMFRGTKACTTLEDAITRVGLQETTNYLWFFSNAGLFESDNEVFSGILSKLREHSMAVAECARLIAKHKKLPKPDEYFYMGLMHDIGAVLVLEILKEVTKDDPHCDAHMINEAVFALHNQFGMVLLKRWKMATVLQEIAQYHDDISQVSQPSTELLVIHFANQFVHQLGYQPEHCVPEDKESTDIESATQLQLDQDFLAETQERITNYINEIDKMLQPPERVSLF